MGLNGSLHAEMVGRGEIVGRDEARRQGRVLAAQAAVEAHGIILDRLLAMAAVGKENLAHIGKREDRLDTARHVSGKERDRAGRGDRCERALRIPWVEIAARSAAGKSRTWPEAR